MCLEDIFTSESIRKNISNNIEFYGLRDEFLEANPGLSVNAYLKKDLGDYHICYELKNGSPDNLRAFQSILNRYYFPFPFYLRPEFSDKTDSEIEAFLAIEIRKA